MTHTILTPLSNPPLNGALLSSNHITYARKTLQYRLDNPRDFRYCGYEGIDAILVDDIVTTGITLQEAQNKLREHGVNVLFALTLADARE
jgi:competence protein ComFC